MHTYTHYIHIEKNIHLYIVCRSSIYALKKCSKKISGLPFVKLLRSFQHGRDTKIDLDYRVHATAPQSNYIITHGIYSQL